MKILVLLGVVAIATLSNARVMKKFSSHGKNITQLINLEEYPVQNITVETKDGYLLDIIRIPGPPSYNKEFEEGRKNHQRTQTNKPAILLMHGLLGSAEDFVAGGNTRGLAYTLADHGYDVYLGNSRGSRYGRKHTQLDPERDSHFWHFCWHSIGKHDLPAIIDKVLEVSGQQKIHYIGHNQGSTAFYVLASQMPKYNSKIDKMIALGPLAFMKHAKHPLMSLINKNRNSPTWITKNLGRGEFAPSSAIRSELGAQQSDCHNPKDDICGSNYFLVNGYSGNINLTLAQQIASSYPDGASTRQLLHYAQLVKSGHFESYDDDYSSSQDSDSSESDSSNSDSSASSNAEDYDLDKVTTDNYLFYVQNDMWYNEEDIESLEQQLPNVVKKVKFSQYSSNVDLLFAEDAHDHVHRSILQCLPSGRLAMSSRSMDTGSHMMG